MSNILTTIGAISATIADDVSSAATKIAITATDDIASTTVKAGSSTAGILGDDLAVGAEKSAKFGAEKELIAIKRIMCGSFKNKFIILPLVFILNWFLPPAITVLLILGAIFLSFEGVEAILEYFGFGHDEEEKSETDEQKILSAIKIDFILSLEIVVIALSAVMDKAMPQQILVTTIVAMAATFGIYGLVAAIVRLDDLGFALIKRGYKRTGLACVSALNKIIKSLSVIGTIAMLLVAGGIVSHHNDFIHHLGEKAGFFGFLFDIGTGVVLGLLTVAVVIAVEKIKSKF